MLWLYLTANRDKAPWRSGTVLCFAPEPSLLRWFRANHGGPLHTVDLHRDDTDVRADITHLPFRANSVALVVCNHVLEHIADDRAAATEIRRVLEPDGQAVLTVPIDWSREVTFEDPAVHEPRERLRVYGQVDHVRTYGRDFADRLRGAGMVVTVLDFVAGIDRQTALRHGLTTNEPIFLCRAVSLQTDCTKTGQFPRDVPALEGSCFDYTPSTRPTHKPVRSNVAHPTQTHVAARTRHT